jgi:probable HAF family extracellular repeat protein
MKSRALMLITMTLFAALAIPLPLVAQEQEIENPPQYTFTNLDTLGGPTSTANGINNKGWVTGVSDLPGGTTFHGFLWQNGVMTDLGTLGGPNSAVIWPVKDNRGLIVGASDTSNTDPSGEDFCGFGTHLICLGFLWQKGVMTPLPTLGGNNGYATGVNNRRQMVGLAENSTRDSSCIAPQVLDWEAVVWGPEGGEIHELPPFPGDSIAAAIAINDNGQVVGGSGPICGPVSATLSLHAVLWQEGSVTDLGSFGGKMNNAGTAINNLGQVVGFSDLAGDTAEHAFLWKGGLMTDLGTLPGDFSSSAFGINNEGQVVGQSCDKTGTCRAFLWQDGVMTDLNTLIPAGSPVLIYGGDINSREEIVGQAFDQSTGKMAAFLLTPSNGEAASGSAAPAARAKDQSPKVTLPPNVREMLQRRLRVGRFGVR